MSLEEGELSLVCSPASSEESCILGTGRVLEHEPLYSAQLIPSGQTHLKFTMFTILNLFEKILKILYTCIVLYSVHVHNKLN